MERRAVWIPGRMRTRRLTVSEHFFRFRWGRRDWNLARRQRRGGRASTGRWQLANKNPVSEADGRSPCRLQLPPLIKREHFAKVEIHHRVLTFQFAARSEHLIDLRLYLAFIGNVCVKQCLESAP